MASDFKEIDFPTPSTPSYTPSLATDYNRQNEILRHLVGRFQRFPDSQALIHRSPMIKRGTVFFFRGKMIEAVKDILLAPHAGTVSSYLRPLYPVISYKKSTREYSCFLVDDFTFTWDEDAFIDKVSDKGAIRQLIPCCYIGSHIRPKIYSLSLIRSIDLGLFPDQLIIDAIAPADKTLLKINLQGSAEKEHRITGFKNNLIFCISLLWPAAQSPGLYSDGSPEATEISDRGVQAMAAASLTWQASATWSQIVSSIRKKQKGTFTASTLNMDSFSSLSFKSGVARAHDVIMRPPDDFSAAEKKAAGGRILRGRLMGPSAVFRTRADITSFSPIGRLVLAEEAEDVILVAARPLEISL